MTTFSPPTAFIFHKRLSTEPDTREAKRARYLYVLESEEECTSSDDGTESIYSVQGKETDYVRDTTDTETKSDISDTEVEYDIASTSEDEQLYSNHTSSGNEFEMIVAGAFAASLHEDSIVDIVDWVTDGDDDSESNDVPDNLQLLNLQKCRMCRTRDTMGCFPLCSHCHQIRKTYYPPRPRKYKHKKSSNNQLSQSSMSTLEFGNSSQPSSSNAISECKFDRFDQAAGSSLEIFLGQSTSSTAASSIELKIASQNSSDPSSNNELCEYKFELTQSSGSSLENLLEKPTNTDLSSIELDVNKIVSQPGSGKDVSGSELSQKSVRLDNPDSGCSSLEFEQSQELKDSNNTPLESSSDPSSSNKVCEYSWSDWALATKEMCIICNVKPKNGIFLHSSDAHLCCCYSCAVKYWTRSKKCAYCNRKVKNVVKAFVV